MGLLTAASTVATWLTLIVTVAGALVVLGVLAASAMYVRERRADRLARREGIRTYYRHHAFAH